MRQVGMVGCALCIILSSCGTDGGHFKMEGRFLNMNQGEIYVYSPEGAVLGFDTIRINGGRFAYEIPCREDATLMLVFPNFSEQPVFAQPGKSVDVKADASHLKEMEVDGTKANKLMTQFRKQVADMSPPEVVKHAALFIADHAESPVAVYLLRRYFVQTNQSSDLAQARKLLSQLQKAQPKNGDVQRLERQLDVLTASLVGKSLPAFTATDLKGNRVTNNQLNGRMAVVTTWSTWNYESQNIQRQLKTRQRRLGGKLQLLGICLDGNVKECQRTLERDSITSPNVCDGLMFDSPLVEKLGLSYLPDNIVIENGRITGRNLSTADLLKKVDSL